VKRIPLRALADPEGQVIEYRAVIEQCLRVPLDRQAGATIDEMRKAIRILDALEAATVTLQLEDADWEFLKRKVDAMPWAVVDRRIVRFHDDVFNAGDESVNGLVRAEEVTV
jgi:hypothetical protein